MINKLISQNTEQPSHGPGIAEAGDVQVRLDVVLD
jgi:hypothetical protein